MIRGGRPSRASRALLVAIAIVTLLVWRPLWLAEILSVLPVFRSTRWPFREIVVLLFFVHVLFIFNYRPLPRHWNWTVWFLALIPLVALGLAGAPSMGPIELSRRLIISGAADAYWREMRPALDARATLVCADLPLVSSSPESMPFPLLPSHNFAALFGVVNVSGFSPSSPYSIDRARMMPPGVNGIYSPEQARIYLEQFPETRVVWLRQTDPPIWSIIDGGQERRLTLDPEH